MLLFDGGLFDFDVYFRVLVLILLCFGVCLLCFGDLVGNGYLLGVWLFWCLVIVGFGWCCFCCFVVGLVIGLCFAVVLWVYFVLVVCLVR